MVVNSRCRTRTAVVRWVSFVAAFALLCNVISIRASTVLVDYADHSIRNRHLLAQISKERIKPAEGESQKDGPSERSWTFRNSTGSLFKCSVGKSTAEDSAPKLKKDGVVEFSQEALDARIELLRGTCVSHDGGWWVTRWCHATEVRQAHYEGAREVTAFSLGTFHGGEVRMAESDTGDNTGAPAQIVSGGKQNVPLFYSEMFLNGNVCHETGKPRATEVRLYCCPKDKTVSLISLQETSTCTYTMTLCWATLCEAGLPPLSPTSRDTWAATRALTGMCFRHAGETGVTHEVCFEKTARSFREVQAKDLKDKGKMSANSVAAQRLVEMEENRFGTFQPTETFKEEDDSTLSPRDDERVVLQVYADGDECATGERYYAHVKIACFLVRSTPPAIVSVRWVSKCGKLILMHAPNLCDADDEHRLRLRKRRRRMDRSLAAGSADKSKQTKDGNVANENDADESESDFSLDAETELSRVSCAEVEA